MKRLRILRRWFARKFGVARLLCLALLIAFVALRIADPAPIEELRVRIFDSFQRIEPRAKMAKSPVVIVDIDEQSLAKVGQWPWSRTRIADLVAGLTRLGAVAIGFDILFPEPDRLNPDVAADTFHDLDEETREKLRSLPSNDRVLADTMRRTRVVLGGDLQGQIYEFAGLLRNTPVLEAAAAGRGMLTINPERDGIIRRVPMITLAQDETMPALSLEMLRVVTGTDTILVKTDQAGIKSVGVRGLEVPTDRNGQLWVHFARPDT